MSCAQTSGDEQRLGGVHGQAHHVAGLHEVPTDQLVDVCSRKQAHLVDLRSNSSQQHFA